MGAPDFSGIGVWFLLLLTGAIVCLIGLTFVTAWLFVRSRERRLAERGFEVKLNAGDTPVLLKERENDHG
jgi:hypothetical protein